MTVLVRDLIAHYLQARPVGEAQRRVLGQMDRTFGRLAPDLLLPGMMSAYRRGRRAADATIRRELGALIAVLNWAERTHLIPRGSVPHIDLPPAGPPRDVWMTREQAQKFEGAAAFFPGYRGRVAPFVSLALNTGARKEAILSLTWDRVDLDGETVDFRVPGQVVSKKRRVLVPMNLRLKSVLFHVKQYRVDTSPYVCGTTSIRPAYEAFTRSVDMAWVTPHVLRHTAATLMLQAGVPLWDVAGVLGDTVETVARVYGHHSTGHLRSAVGALGAAA